MKIYLIPTLVLLTTACVPQHDDLAQWVAHTRQVALKRVAPVDIPPVAANPAYAPPPQNGLNAFDSRRLSAIDRSRNAPDIHRSKEVLEAFDLENLKYVGFVKENGRISGYIEAEGHVYTVKPGNYMGQNYGRIQSITPDKIVLIETIEDSMDGWIFQQTELPLSSGNETQQQNTQ